MFRKLSHIIVSVLLLIATIGFTALNNFCSGESIAVTIQTDQTECCDITSACCQKNAETFKIDTEYLGASFSFKFEEVSLEIPALRVLASVINDFPALLQSDSKRSSLPVTLSKERSYFQVFLL